MSLDPALDAWLGPAPAFAEVVRAVEAAAGRRGRTGRAGPPAEEAALFRAAPSFGFPAADVSAIRQGTGGWPFEVEVNFLGLYGPSSPLPPAWTERIARQEPGHANLRDLLDLFNHPLIGLLWRNWRDARPHLAWQGDGGDPHSVAVLALAGVMPGAAGGLPPVRLLPLCALLVERTRGAAAVTAALELALGVPVEVEEWCLRRAEVPEEQLGRLGVARLGESVLGETVPDVAGTVRLRLGPLTLRRFLALLPGGAERPSLAPLLRLVLAVPARLEVELALEAGASRGATLGSTRLGYTSWLGDPDRVYRCDTGVA